MRDIIQLRYEGKKIRAREGMDANEVAEAIEGFSDFLRSISQIVYGQETETSPTIRGIREGSLEIQFVYEVAAIANTIISAGSIQNLGDVIKQIFDLLKHLKGDAPKSIKQADHGSVIVENNSGQILVVNQPVINVVINGDAGSNAEQFARRPLNNDADKLEIKVNGKQSAEIGKAAADFFVPIGAGEKLGEYTAEQHLTIQTVVLEGDGNWRFSDGRNKFRAEITDRKFLQRVKEGKERFGRGDILRVRLKSRQEKIRGQLRTTHFIEEVIGHEPFRGSQNATNLILLHLSHPKHPKLSLRHRRVERRA